jgi:ABC-type transport system involved in multi-copper enzyme maturation permease subunit
MSAVLSLAHHTLLDALRERIFRTLALFVIVLFGVAQVVKPLALGEGRRVTLDIGLTLVTLAGLLLVLFLGARAVQREIERRTILVLLACPVRRGEFLLGKFLGMLAVVGIALAGMLVLLALVLWASGYGFEGGLLVAGLFALFELAILCALSLGLTAVASPVLAACGLLAAFVAGHLAPSLLATSALASGSVAGALARSLFQVVPRFDLYNVTLEVVHGTPVTAGAVLWAGAYAVLYSGAALLAALLVLRRREFV